LKKEKTQNFRNSLQKYEKIFEIFLKSKNLSLKSNFNSLSLSLSPLQNLQVAFQINLLPPLLCKNIWPWRKKFQ
jgi:hypothetical protein